MVKITEVTYGRSVIPDNPAPNMDLKRYESEQFRFHAIATDDNETINDLIDACEREVLKQHKRLEEKRSARKNATGLVDELDNIKEKLEELRSDPNSLYDDRKLLARKNEIETLLKEIE